MSAPTEAGPGVSDRRMVVWCPDWPVVAALMRRPTEAPVAVMSGHRVLACSPSARDDGVRRGMRRRDAQARCPELVLLDHEPEAEARAFEVVLSGLESLVAGVAPLRPGLCALRPPSRWYGGEAEAAAVVAEHLVGLGVWDSRAGVADTLFAAEQAARRAPAQDSVVVPPGESAAFLATLPVEVLEAADLVSLLRRMGLTTLRDFGALPAADVHTRFGREGALLHRLARGLEARPLAARAVPPELSAELSFEPPLSRVDQVAFSLRTTAERFVARLADAGLVCTQVRVEVDAEGELVSARSWSHPRWFASTDVVDRVRWQLQAARGVEAPVGAVRLVPETLESLGDHAESLFGGGPDAAVERAVARVQSMVGHASVLSAGLQGGRTPAARQLLTPWGDKPVASRPASLPWPGSLPPPAPATVFARPHEALVVGAEGHAVGVTGRGTVTGEPALFRAEPHADWQPVASWAGPWPVDELWWDEAAARRIARFQVVGVDGSAWLMMVEDGRWWTEARYD